MFLPLELVCILTCRMAFMLFVQRPLVLASWSPTLWSLASSQTGGRVLLKALKITLTPYSKMVFNGAFNRYEKIMYFLVDFSLVLLFYLFFIMCVFLLSLQGSVKYSIYRIARRIVAVEQSLLNLLIFSCFSSVIHLTPTSVCVSWGWWTGWTSLTSLIVKVWWV